MTKLWLLEQSVYEAIHSAPALTAAQVRDCAAVFGGMASKADRVLAVAGSRATINVRGVMTSAPDFFAMLFGGGNTLYGDINAAIDQAEQDPRVKSVDFKFDTPGGEVKGITSVGDKIFAMAKPTRAVVSLAASGGYWLASQANEIVAEDRSSAVGSIGVVRTMVKNEASPYVEITSTNAPNKRPDISTESGMAAVKAELDAVEDLFITAIALGRDTTTENVLNSFGRGGMLLAQDALSAGMIDKIAGKPPKKSTQTKATGAKTMDLATLKAEHPAVFQQAFEEGQTAGAAKERDRVSFHATMGKNNACMDIAIDACINGTAKDDGVTLAGYLSAGRNAGDLANRAAAEAALGGNNPSVSAEAAKEAAVNATFAKTAELCGIKLEA